MRKKLKFYLVGPIQWTEDFMNWRIDLREYLEDQGHEGLLPWGEIYHGKMGRLVFTKWAKSMSRDDYLGRVRKYFRKYVIKWDIRAVEACDGIIFWLPKDIPTVGSHGECTLIYYLVHHKKLAKWRASHKKIFVVTTIPAKDLSYWLIGCSDRIFFNWNEFKAYFGKRFNNKKKKVNNK